MNARALFKASSIVEVSIGLALLVAPLFLAGLLLGDELDINKEAAQKRAAFPRS